MIYKAVIFDMDGTIVDTEKVWERATCDLLERKKVPCTPELLSLIRHNIQGLDVTKSCTFIKNLTGMTEPVSVIQDEKEAIAHGLYEEGIRFITGFVEFHAELRARGIKTAIATNAHDLTIHLTQNALNIRHFFGEHMYGIDNVAGIGKPSPDVYLHAAKKIDIDPVLCVGIEDSAHGIAAVKNAGMFCIGINTACKPEQVACADYIVESYAQIDIDMLFEKMAETETI